MSQGSHWFLVPLSGTSVLFESFWEHPLGQYAVWNRSSFMMDGSHVSSPLLSYLEIPCLTEADSRSVHSVWFASLAATARPRHTAEDQKTPADIRSILLYTLKRSRHLLGSTERKGRAHSRALVCSCVHLAVGSEYPGIFIPRSFPRPGQRWAEAVMSLHQN